MSSELRAEAPLESVPVTLNIDHVSAVTRLLEKRKEMARAQRALEAQKAEYIRQEEMFRTREELLRKRDLELQESLVIFNKFLKENEHKRLRAEQKAQEEAKNFRNREMELRNLEATLRDRQRVLERKRREQQRHAPYQQFLQSVAEPHSSYFAQEGATVDDVLTRYKVLASAKEDLEAQLQQYGAAYRDLQVEIQRHHKEAYSRTLQHNNEIANLSRKLEAAVAESAQLEESVRIVEAGMLNQQSILSVMTMGVDNLLSRCVKKPIIDGQPMQIHHYDRKKGRKLTPEEQLDVVSAYLSDFAAMLNALTKSKAGQGGQGAGQGIGGTGAQGGVGGGASWGYGDGVGEREMSEEDKARDDGGKTKRKVGGSGDSRGKGAAGGNSSSSSSGSNSNNHGNGILGSVAGGSASGKKGTPSLSSTGAMSSRSSSIASTGSSNSSLSNSSSNSSSNGRSALGSMRGGYTSGG